MINAKTIQEAEVKARRHPSSHGFANAYDVTTYKRADSRAWTTEDIEAAKAATTAALDAAGYAWCEARSRYERDDFWATTRVTKTYACVFVHCGCGAVALAAGEAGYLPSGDNPILS